MTSYHHGDLPRQLLAHAAAMAAEADPESISLRELARRTGVSHSAPVHHFGTRQGLLTALAVEGFTGLNEALARHQDNLSEMGVAYVTWALEHPGYYTVMWRPRLLSDSSEDLIRTREQSWSLLCTAVSGSAATDHEAKADAYAAFAVVHGLSSLWLSEALPRPQDTTALTREVTRKLARDPGSSDS